MSKKKKVELFEGELMDLKDLMLKMSTILYADKTVEDIAEKANTNIKRYSFEESSTLVGY